eukprot:Pompholyxophrys_punicea_v1_NODE_1266_length_829_cov_7.773902.p1 type:complete len:136 gc:universal NODE_1266_length_829_cov_7.773902:659-252(-)
MVTIAFVLSLLFGVAFFSLVLFFVVSKHAERIKLSTFLSKNNMKHLIAKFEEEEIHTLDDLFLLKNQDYEKLGIKIGERNRIKRLLSDLNHPLNDLEKNKKLVLIGQVNFFFFLQSEGESESLETMVPRRYDRSF